MTERKILATERIDKKQYRLVLIPAGSLIFLMVFSMAYQQAIVTDDLYDIIHWLIWGTIMAIMSLLIISIYANTVTALDIYEEGIEIHIIHLYPFMKKFIYFSEIRKIIAAEGPKGGFTFFTYLENGKKYHKVLYVKIQKGKVIEDNNDIIKLIESKTKGRFQWITWDEWVHTRF